MSVLADIAKGSENGVLVVTHDPRTVPYADRIIRIEDGEIVGEERNDEAKKAEAKKAARSLRQ
jgi:putative ABC transport system ATP-binding protein